MADQPSITRVEIPRALRGVQQAIQQQETAPISTVQPLPIPGPGPATQRFQDLILNRQTNLPPSTLQRIEADLQAAGIQPTVGMLRNLVGPGGMQMLLEEQMLLNQLSTGFATPDQLEALSLMRARNLSEARQTTDVNRKIEADKVTRLNNLTRNKQAFANFLARIDSTATRRESTAAANQRAKAAAEREKDREMLPIVREFEDAGIDSLFLLDTFQEAFKQEDFEFIKPDQAKALEKFNELTPAEQSRVRKSFATGRSGLNVVAGAPVKPKSPLFNELSQKYAPMITGGRLQEAQDMMRKEDLGKVMTLPLNERNEFMQNFAPIFQAEQ